MRTVSTSLLLVLAATTVVHADRKATLELPAAPQQVNDQVSITTTTTITRGSGDTLRKSTRKAVTGIRIDRLDQGSVARARVKLWKPVVTGTLVSWGSFPDVCFGYEPSAAAGARIVFDPGDGVEHEDTWDALTAAQRTRFEARAASIVLFPPTFAGRTFEPGTTLELGGQEIEVWGDPHVELTDASLTYRKLDTGVAVFDLTARVAIKLKDGTKVSGAVAGAMKVDGTTGKLKSVRLEGDLTSAGGADVVHVTHTAGFVFESITWN